jgi:hypothetical protein
MGYEELQFVLRSGWLEGDQNLLVIEAYDNVGRNSSVTYRIRMDMVPNVTAIEPLTGSVFLDNQTIVFSVHAEDLDGDEDLTFSWMSNKVGIIGSSGSFEYSLPPGDHLITVTVKDGAHTIKRTITVRVLDHLLLTPDKMDSDGDGMNDEFEDRYRSDPLNGIKGLDKDVPDADRDLDGDSYTNYQEFLAGTDPLDSSSYPGSTITEESFPLAPSVLAAVAFLVLLVMVVMVVIESRRTPAMPPQMAAYGYQYTDPNLMVGQGHAPLPVPSRQSLPPMRPQ